MRGRLTQQFVVVFRGNKVLPDFYGKHDLNGNLRTVIGHAPKMPLLTELENVILGWAPNIPPLTGLGPNNPEAGMK
jgi:hypothetical protein